MKSNSKHCHSFQDCYTGMTASVVFLVLMIMTAFIPCCLAERWINPFTLKLGGFRIVWVIVGGLSMGVIFFVKFFLAYRRLRRDEEPR